MYQLEYNQSYGQHGSYNQYHGNYGGYNSYAPPSPRIVLDDYNSDLNFVVEPGGVTGSSLHENGFEYMWAGARATHGVRAGKVRTYITLDLFTHFIKAQDTHKHWRSVV